MIGEMEGLKGSLVAMELNLFDHKIPLGHATIQSPLEIVSH